MNVFDVLSVVDFCWCVSEHVTANKRLFTQQADGLKLRRVDGIGMCQLVVANISSSTDFILEIPSNSCNPFNLRNLASTLG